MVGGHNRERKVNGYLTALLRHLIRPVLAVSACAAETPGTRLAASFSNSMAVGRPTSLGGDEIDDVHCSDDRAQFYLGNGHAVGRTGWLIAQ